MKNLTIITIVTILVTCGCYSTKTSPPGEEYFVNAEPAVAEWVDYDIRTPSATIELADEDRTILEGDLGLFDPCSPNIGHCDNPDMFCVDMYYEYGVAPYCTHTCSDPCPAGMTECIVSNSSSCNGWSCLVTVSTGSVCAPF